MDCRKQTDVQALKNLYYKSSKEGELNIPSLSFKNLQFKVIKFCFHYILFLYIVLTHAQSCIFSEKAPYLNSNIPLLTGAGLRIALMCHMTPILVT